MFGRHSIGAWEENKQDFRCMGIEGVKVSNSMEKVQSKVIR